jgi:hypothetical protein
MLCSIDFDFFAANTCSEPDKIECACCTHCCNPGAFYCEYVWYFDIRNLEPDHYKYEERLWTYIHLRIDAWNDFAWLYILLIRR